MSTSMKLKNVERKIKDYNVSLTQFEEQFIIVPFQPSGYIDYSNFGQITNQLKINQFETYKRLYTGNDAFIVTWKDSVKFDYSNQTTGNTTESIKLSWQVGEAFLGWVENDTTDSEISTDTSFSEYKSQKAITSYTFRINAARFELTEEYTYYFYKVPEISNQILFKVVSLEKEYLGKDLICYVLRLESLQDTLANTGRAKQQNVMPNAPGQGYLQPQVVQKAEYTLSENAVVGVDYLDFGDRYVIANKTYQQNNPVKKIVLKLFGLAVLSNVVLIGRRAYLGGDFKSYGSPRLIFPFNFSTPTTETIYRTQQAETNFYWAISMYPEINFSAEIFDRLKNFLDFNKFWSSQGLMKIDKTQTVATNPNPDGKYIYQLYGQQTSNGYQQWIFSFNQKKIDTSYTYGCAQQYTIGGDKTVHNHMFDSYWIQKQISVLPINKTNTLNFGWTVGASYAAAVAGNIYTGTALMMIGIAGTLYQKYTALSFQGMFGLIPASLCDFIMSECQTTLGTSDDNLSMKLSYFIGSEDDDIGTFFKTSTLNTSFEAHLTDLIQKDGVVYSTEEIGQTVRSDGSNIFENGSALLMDGSYQLKELTEENYGFIIDSFNIQAIFSGDFSVEFLDLNGEVIWYGVYQSQAKWTGSIREINTWKETSIFGRENKYLGKPLNWPKALQPLDPLQLTENKIFQPENLIYTWQYWNNNPNNYYGNGTNYERKFWCGRQELVDMKDHPSWNNFTNWTTTKTTDDGQQILTGYLHGGETNLGNIVIMNGFGTMKSFINYYNKAKVKVGFGLIISNNMDIGLNLDNIIDQEFTWEIDSQTTTKWQTFHIEETTNGKYDVSYKKEGYVYNGFLIPGVYDWAGIFYGWGNMYRQNNGSFSPGALHQEEGGGLITSPTGVEYFYYYNYDVQVRLAIYNSVVVLEAKTINNRFEWKANGVPTRNDSRGWLVGSYNTVFDNAGYGRWWQTKIRFGIKVQSLELLRNWD